MKNNLNYKRLLPELILFGLIILVFIFRWPYLSLHFFWDEAWVYGPAVKYIVNNGIGITPEVLPEVISRGHPILFHLLYSSLPFVVGDDSVFTIHLWALILNVLLLIGFYICLSKLSNKWIAVLSTIFLLINSVIIAQINLVLPEIILGFLIFYAITAFSLKNLKLYSLFTALAMLIKESALILPISIGLFSMVDFLFQKEKKISSLKNISLYTIVSFIPISVFFLIQYYQRGYIFFPEHMGMIKLNYRYFRDNFELIYNFIFLNQGRYIVSLILFFIIIFFSNLSWKKGILSLVIGFTIMKIIFRAWSISPIPNLILLGILFSIFYLITFYWPLKEDKTKATKSIFFNLSVLFSILYFLFSSINFFTLRYTTPLVILFIGFFSLWIFNQFKFKAISPYLISILIVPTAIYTLNPNNSKLGDTEIFYSDALIVQKQLYDYLHKNKLVDASYYGNFTNEVALNNSNAGLVLENQEVKNIGRFNIKERDYIIQSNYDEALPLDTLPFNFDTLKSFEYKRARIDLLEIKSPQH